MTTYHSYKVNLSEGQTKKLLTAIKNNNPLTLSLSNQDLSGNDTLMLTQRQINKLTKAKKAGVGSDLNISKTQIRKVLKLGHGAPHLGSPMPMHRITPRPNRTKKPTNTSSTKKNGGKIKVPNKRYALSYRSPPFIGSWDQYNKFLKTGGLVLPKKKILKPKKK